MTLEEKVKHIIFNGVGRIIAKGDFAFNKGDTYSISGEMVQKICALLKEEEKNETN